MGCGLSYHRLTGDTQRSSYTAIRASHLDDAAMVRPVQQFFGRKVSLRVRQEHTLQAAGFGRYRRMTANYLAKNLWSTLRFDVIGPGREQLDPEKETDAALARIRGGTSTLKIECGLRGLHYRAVLRQLAKEQDLAEQLGLGWLFQPVAPSGAPAREDARLIDDDLDRDVEDDE
jgi:capsid protein